jgi:uncharacterized protein (TIGR02646 family)
MRPVNKGPHPSDVGGRPIVFSKYQDANPHLRNRIGYYCSYCEIEFKYGLAVEHVVPKNPHTGNPALQLAWDNFLLACPYCNSCKGKTAIDVAGYFWPDRDNTLRAFSYDGSGIVRPLPNLQPLEIALAQSTINLFGLNRSKTTRPKASRRDERYRFREIAWRTAVEARADIERNDSEHLRKWITRHSVSIGSFSIWMTVFKDDVDMKRRLIEAFIGTASNCFDAQCNPISRLGGRI